MILDDDGVAAAPPVEIAHGSRVLADLAPPVGRTSDVDFYVLRHDLHSSYEIVVDAVSGDAVPLTVERVVADGGVFQTGAADAAPATASRMRFFGLGVSTDHIRVAQRGLRDDVRTRRRLPAAHVRDDADRSPRVNNRGLQSTVADLQNPTDAPIQASASCWSAGGLMCVRPCRSTCRPRGRRRRHRRVLPDFSGSRRPSA